MRRMVQLVASSWAGNGQASFHRAAHFGSLHACFVSSPRSRGQPSSPPIGPCLLQGARRGLDLGHARRSRLGASESPGSVPSSRDVTAVWLVLVVSLGGDESHVPINTLIQYTPIYAC